VPHIEDGYAGPAGGFDHAADLRQHQGPVAHVGQYPHLSVVDQNGNTRGLAHLGHRLRHIHPERVLHAGDGATLVARGGTNAEIADDLHIGLSTVKTHLANLDAGTASRSPCGVRDRPSHRLSPTLQNRPGTG
jgi:hypothetical protein